MNWTRMIETLIIAAIVSIGSGIVTQKVLENEMKHLTSDVVEIKHEISGIKTFQSQFGNEQSSRGPRIEQNEEDIERLYELLGK